MVSKAQEAFDRLLSKVLMHNPTADVEMISRAFYIADNAHRFQFRASGEQYIMHPIAVADILAELKLDTPTIITALLHDTVEDSMVNLQEIECEFGHKIASMVSGITKLTQIEYKPQNIKQAENFRKLLLSVSKDIRVLLVKLADRLHNMRTIEHIPSEDKRMRIAQETIEIYSPLAERIGIYTFKNELEDLAFAHLHPQVRLSILEKLESRYISADANIKLVDSNLRATLDSCGVPYTLSSRKKTLYSIWHKMQYKNISFDHLSDIVGFRVIVDNVSSCYRVLGILHRRYHSIAEAFQDYISNPKPNGYESLHTILIGPDNNKVEIQIRSQKMHEVAEFGVASHWVYKQKVRDSNIENIQYLWVNEMLSILRQSASPEEFMEHSKLEMYNDKIFCFTPRGALISLPQGSTPLDFAFAIHSSVGLTCIGAKVNGQIVSLKTVLNNGEHVDIIRSQISTVLPSWEKIVVSSKARSEIRKFIRLNQQKEFAQRGWAMIKQEFYRNNLIYRDYYLYKALEPLKFSSIQELRIAIGKGLITTQQLNKYIEPLQKNIVKSLGHRFYNWCKKILSYLPLYLPTFRASPNLQDQSTTKLYLENFHSSNSQQIRVLVHHGNEAINAVIDLFGQANHLVLNIVILSKTTDIVELIIESASAFSNTLENLLLMLRSSPDVQGAVLISQGQSTISKSQPKD